ncbi:unnamed protein product [Mycena citricolor]|uniref:DUF4203 domain-containing protein n=1 Tax=Mycena citricolor TaxID=2018698 RepID=A0AAD2JUA9_9AGAR|nr:unnamed protein product [Mycena citricolor]
MAINDTTTLTTLLSSTPYLLAYSLPLLLLSVLSTFSGAFLTLDRTRSFPAERYGVLPGAFESQKRRVLFLLEGGVGGLATGYAFGVHLTTFLSLMIPAVSTSSPLNSKTFVAVWILSAAITTLSAGRWRLAALAFGGIAGGALFGLAVSVIIHPPLIVRIIIVAILSSTSALVAVLPISSIQPHAVRFSTSAIGAFGLVVSIALLAHIPSWANVWERLWVDDDLSNTWGSGAEKGLAAAFCLFLTLGGVCDWLLKRQFGECPDEKWDAYLANYAASLSNGARRAGTFQPFTSAWDRWFGDERPAVPDPAFPPDDLDSKMPPESFEFQRGPAFLKKGRSVGHARFQAKMGGRKRDGIKFKPLGGESSDEDDLLTSPPGSPKIQRPWLRQKLSMTSTAATLVDDVSSTKSKDLDFEKEMARVRNKKRSMDGPAPEYSDLEDDLTQIGSSAGLKDNKEWSPGFLARHRSGAESSLAPSNASQAPSRTSQVAPSPQAVPATPSLIKALDRIALAQTDAFSPKGSERAVSPVSPHKEVRWDAFWKDVDSKAT